jgi:TolB-like protein
VDEFFVRLRQRKIVQWALTYAAAAFALIQVLDVVAQRFGWPEVLERSLIVALAIGFFIVLVLAWYHGERGAQRVTGTELLILALLLAIGGAGMWKFSASPATTAAAATGSAVVGGSATIPHKSIAVLPFTDLSPGHDQEYFSDGMAEEILGALAKIKDLKVAGRTSSFSFKGKNEDLRVIGKALAVAHVLEGSVRKQGDRVRVTAQLIQAEDGYHMWSETYDGDLRDVFELQERIARAIVGQLQVVLQGDQQQRLVPVATVNTEAYSLYLQASGIFSRREGPRLPEAIAELEQALKLDPKFARAHSRLAAIHAIEPIYTPSLSDTSLAAAEHSRNHMRPWRLPTSSAAATSTRASPSNARLQLIPMTRRPIFGPASTSPTPATRQRAARYSITHSRSIPCCPMRCCGAESSTPTPVTSNVPKSCCAAQRT